MNNVSAFGLKVQLTASNTFPAGITITQFADDADPFDTPAVTIADTASGINGDLVVWSKANPIKSTVNVIPGSDDDINLAILYEANRVGRGKTSAQDVIRMVGIYPDGSTVSLTNGVIVEGMPGTSVAAAGRQKSKPYMFHFEGLART